MQIRGLNLSSLGNPKINPKTTALWAATTNHRHQGWGQSIGLGGTRCIASQWERPASKPSDVRWLHLSPRAVYVTPHTWQGCLKEPSPCACQNGKCSPFPFRKERISLEKQMQLMFLLLIFAAPRFCLPSMTWWGWGRHGLLGVLLGNHAQSCSLTHQLATAGPHSAQLPTMFFSIGSSLPVFLSILLVGLSTLLSSQIS